MMPGACDGSWGRRDHIAHTPAFRGEGDALHDVGGDVDSLVDIVPMCKYDEVWGSEVGDGTDSFSVDVGRSSDMARGAGAGSSVRTISGDGTVWIFSGGASDFSAGVSVVISVVGASTGVIGAGATSAGGGS